MADLDNAEKNAVIKDLEDRKERFSERTADGYNSNRQEEVAVVALNLQALQRLINALKRGQGRLPEESMQAYLSRMLKSYKDYLSVLIAYAKAVHAARERGQAMRVRNLVDVQGFPIYVPPGGGLFAKRPARDWEAEFDAEDRQADEADRRYFEEKRRPEQQRRQPRYIVDADEYYEGTMPPSLPPAAIPKPDQGLPKVPTTPGSAGGPKKQKSASPGEEALDVDAMIEALASVLRDPEVRKNQSLKVEGKIELTLFLCLDQFYKSGTDATLDAEVKDFMRFVRTNYKAPDVIGDDVKSISLEGICGHCCSSGAHVSSRCPKCKHAYYCSKDCYHKDYNEHHKHHCTKKC